MSSVESSITISPLSTATSWPVSSQMRLLVLLTLAITTQSA